MINEFLKGIILTTITYILFNKIACVCSRLIKKIIIGIVFVFFTSGALFLIGLAVSEPYKTALIIFISATYLSLIYKEKFRFTLVIIIIAYAISYILYLFTMLVAIIIMDLLGITGDNILIIILGCVFDIVFVTLISKIRVSINLADKKGASGIGLIISGITFVFYSLMRKKPIDYDLWLMTSVVALTGYGIYYWWKRETAIAHNDKVNEIINKKLQGIIDEKEKDNMILTEAHNYLASVVHKDNKKLDAMQRAVEKLILRSQHIDVITDAKKILEDIKIFKNQASDEFSKKLSDGKILPTTGLPLVDAKFEVLLETATIHKIYIDFEIDSTIDELESLIPPLDIINIIGDLVENAFISIKHFGQHKTNGNVLVGIGKYNDAYEFSVWDSGIPFDINTLINLGMNRITTHADEGGSGYGYVTIFEKLNICDASLIITEYEPIYFLYSKCITIRFDGKGAYMINSYRAEIINTQNTNNNLTVTLITK